MSLKPFDRSADLRRLREEGYFVQLWNGFLVMREVPYVDAERQVRSGTLISSLTMAGDQTQPPDTHVVSFDGEYPCGADGRPIEQIRNATELHNLGNGLAARHRFSSKPPGGYTDYHHKMTTYANILSGPAAVLQPGATAKVFRVPEEEEQNIFNYVETASDRAGIGALTERLERERIAIVGLGGTGSYILDLVAKTPVREIRLIDGDEFLQHNAFRAPGAPSIEELRLARKKVDYLRDIYVKMHRGIVAHATPLDAGNLGLLDGITFAFLSMDASEAKRLVVSRLEGFGVPFIDVGMGLELVDGSLGGILRVTTSLPSRRDHVHRHLSYAEPGDDDVYGSNIQVADLNALNAVLAVIKWKKIRGFYRDLDRECHSTYTTDGNLLLNSEVG
jgi:hypothetical protein